MIEGHCDWTGTYVYDFYKQLDFYHTSQIKFYGEKLRREQLLVFVSNYFSYQLKLKVKQSESKNGKSNERILVVTKFSVIKVN